MRDSVRKGELKLNEMNDLDYGALLTESILNSDVGLVTRLIEERTFLAYNFRDSSQMTSKN